MEFGEYIQVTERYKRRERERKQEIPRLEGEYYCTWKVWEKVPYAGGKCLFLGFRTLSNGIRDFDSDYGHTFIPKEYFKVALVCPGPKYNPVYVPIP